MHTTDRPVPPHQEGGPVGVPGPVRLRLDISYDGTDFAGWAIQPGLRTVEGVLDDALALLFRRRVRLVVAGRTDAGVHAVGQVAHIDVDPSALAALAPHRRRPQSAGERPPDACAGLLRRLAGMLASDIRVRAVTPAPPGFDARHSALRRHYRYRISTARWGADPLDRAAVLARQRSLDTAAMQQAAQSLLGLRDFATFCKARPYGTTIRELQQLSVSSVGDEVVVVVAADAFCHSMVRSLVGVLMAVGEGRMPVSEPARMLAARQRSGAVYTAAARGLTLVQVDYPADAALAARATETRAVRNSTASDSTAAHDNADDDNADDEGSS